MKLDDGAVVRLDSSVTSARVLEPAAEVAGRDEVGKVLAQLIMVPIVEASVVASLMVRFIFSTFPLSGMSSLVPIHPAVPSSGTALMVSPSGTWAPDHESAGRPTVDRVLRARARCGHPLATFPAALRAGMTRSRVARQLPSLTCQEGGNRHAHHGIGYPPRLRRSSGTEGWQTQATRPRRHAARSAGRRSPRSRRDAAEDAAADGVVGDAPEEALDLVQPGGKGRGEVEAEALMPGKPGFDLGMLVGGVVVDHQLQGELLGRVAIDRAQEAQELLVAVSRHAFADDLAGGHFEGGNSIVVPLRL